MNVRLLLVAAFVGCITGCSKAGDESKARRSPIPPPPLAVEIPKDLNIAVEIDGKPAPPVDRERLAALKPDYADEDRRAWRLSTVLGAAASKPSAAVEAVSDKGVAMSMRIPKSPDEPQPVLFLTRRGDVLVSMVVPEDPFPEFHGQGGRLRRPGDSGPRLAAVVELRVSSKGKGGNNRARAAAASSPSDAGVSGRYGRARAPVTGQTCGTSDIDGAR